MYRWFCIEFNVKITHYYRYGSHVAEAFGLPLAEIETRHIRGDYLVNDDPTMHTTISKVYKADKVWRKIDNDPITIIKSRDGNSEFDEEEFVHMLFVAEEMPAKHLGA
jgi:hypothetical protein